MKKQKILCWTIGLILLVLSSPETGAQEPNEISTATLPLTEVLRLYQEIWMEKQAVDLPDTPKFPPIQATISDIGIHGQLLDKALDITVHFRVIVLEENDWVSVPLFETDDATHVSTLPFVENGFIIQQDRTVSLVTNKNGTYDFDMSLLKNAHSMGKTRQVEITFSPAVKSEMRLQYDEDLFQLQNKNPIPKPDGVVLYPVNNQYHLHWEQRYETNAGAKPKPEKPPIESMINSAYVSSVTTLEGEWLSRIMYDLSFEGTKKMSFELPEQYHLKKVYMNRSAIPFEVIENKVELEVEPTRAGDRGGQIELVMSRQQGQFQLSGRLDFQLPRVSWPVREMFMNVHLPEVFNYQLQGGSMFPVEKTPPVTFTYDLPTPGKVFSFRQMLITSSPPTASMEYAIDLTGKFFVAP